MFTVQRFEVPRKKPRNKYPLKSLRRIGDGFVVPKEFVPRGSLHGIGRYLGFRLSVETLKDGSKKIVRVG